MWMVRSVRADVARIRAADAALAARADQQHRWTMSGDERGTFGDYPPAAP
ncbi:MAG: hypothetical protein WA285_06060 [Mycobacterium sp.]